jgi:hypothetical protein
MSSSDDSCARERASNDARRWNSCRVFGARARAYVRATNDALRAMGANEFSSDRWLLDTKYYVARVTPVVVEDALERETDASNEDVAVDPSRPARETRSMGDAECAGAAVLACASELEFERARASMVATMGHAIDACEARIVAYDCGGASMEAVPERVRAWALDEMFEVVRVRLDDAEADEAMSRDAADEEDSHGVRRTIEAMKSIVWGDLDLKELGRSSDLGREMRGGGDYEEATSASLGRGSRDVAADVRSIEVASELLGEDESLDSPSGNERLHEKIAKLYDKQLSMKSKQRLEHLADLLAESLESEL